MPHTMPNAIAHNNKDVLFKVLSQHYKDKSFAVYGLHLPRVKQMLPAAHPVIATEHNSDNLFLLEDGSLLILEYESQALRANFTKYTRYVLEAVERLRREGIEITHVTIAVVYTGDIQKAENVYDISALRLEVQQVFLSNFDTNALYTDLATKIKSNTPLSDDDVLRLIILPLTQPDKQQKQKLIENAVALAKQIPDDATQLFTLAGILTATDKFIDKDYSNQIKEWLKLTHVARLYEEEKIEAVNQAVKQVKDEARKMASEVADQTRKDERMELAQLLLQDGEDYLKVMRYTRLTRKEVEEIRASLQIA